MKVRKSGLEDGIAVAVVLEPGQEARDFVVEACGGGSFEVHALAPDREQRRVPRAQPLHRQRRAEVPRGVEHDLDDALHRAAGRREVGGVQAEPARERGAHFGGIEPLPLDRAGGEDLALKGVQAGFRAELGAEGFHPPQQPAEVEPGFGQSRCQEGGLPRQRRPAGEFVDVGHSPHVLR